MLPPECCYILPTGQPCTQLALRGQSLCRFHQRAARVEQTLLEEELLGQKIASLPLAELLVCLERTVGDALRHRVSPRRQSLVFRAALQRLQDLEDEEASSAALHPPAAPEAPALGPAPLPAAFPRPSALACPGTEPSMPAPPPRMEELIGPHFAALPVPPGVDMHLLRQALHHLRQNAARTLLSQPTAVTLSPAAR